MKLAHRKSEQLAPTTSRELPIERLVDRYGVNPSLIEKRYFECDDVFNEDWGTNSIYRLSSDRPVGLDIYERHQFYKDRSREVLQSLFPDDHNVPHHLIHVTCTGYLAPGPAQVLASERNWTETSVTHAYHMGCYASIPSIRMAQAFHSHSNRPIDVVHTEMCSLHMNPGSHEPEQIVVQSLFADGHIKYQVGKKSDNEVGLEIILIKEKIVPRSLDDMTWTPGPSGMQMSLSKDVPNKLKKIIHQFYTELIQEAGLIPAEILHSAIFAVHPGGPKIIDAIQEELGLRDDQIAQSRQVLRERGNMSSATLPHIWENILKAKVLPDQYVISFAFGPGLTIFGSIFRIQE